MSKHSPLSFSLRADLYTHLAAMEKAGLPTDKAFAMLKLPAPAQARVEAMRKLLARGKDIASAGQQSGLFAELEVHLLRAATSAGSPANTYRRLADRFTLKTKLSKAVRSRLKLPLAVFILALLLQPLPALVAGSITASGYLWSCLRPMLLLAGVAALIKALIAWPENAPPSPLRNSLEKILIQLPLFGRMHVRRNARDFFESLGMMLEAGLPMFEALPKACTTITNHLIRNEYAGILGKMKNGATMAESMQNFHYLGERHVVALVQTGEASGTLPEMLLRHAGNESEAIASFQQQAAAWMPRIVYAVLAAGMAYSILTSGAFMPHLPAELR